MRAGGAPGFGMSQIAFKGIQVFGPEVTRTPASGVAS